MKTFNLYIIALFFVSTNSHTFAKTHSHLVRITQEENKTKYYAEIQIRDENPTQATLRWVTEDGEELETSNHPQGLPTSLNNEALEALLAMISGKTTEWVVIKRNPGLVSLDRDKETGLRVQTFLVEADMTESQKELYDPSRPTLRFDQTGNLTQIDPGFMESHLNGRATIEEFFMQEAPSMESNHSSKWTANQPNLLVDQILPASEYIEGRQNEKAFLRFGLPFVWYVPREKDEEEDEAPLPIGLKSYLPLRPITAPTDGKVWVLFEPEVLDSLSLLMGIGDPALPIVLAPGTSTTHLFRQAIRQRFNMGTLGANMPAFSVDLKHLRLIEEREAFDQAVTRAQAPYHQMRVSFRLDVDAKILAQVYGAALSLQYFYSKAPSTPLVVSLTHLVKLGVIAPDRAHECRHALQEGDFPALSEQLP